MSEQAEGAEMRGLDQRVLAIIDRIERVQATGKNQYNVPALSIEDVENALRPHLVSEGVVIHWSINTMTLLDGGKLWQGWYRVVLRNADNPDDLIEVFWTDVGGTPSAADSFARKSYYKALFHLATGEDDTAADRPTTRQNNEARQRRTEDAPVASSGSERQTQAAQTTAATAQQPVGINGSKAGERAATRQELQALDAELRTLAEMRGRGESDATVRSVARRHLGITRTGSQMPASEALQLLAWVKTQCELIRVNRQPEAVVDGEVVGENSSPSIAEDDNTAFPGVAIGASQVVAMRQKLTDELKQKLWILGQATGKDSTSLLANAQTENNISVTDWETVSPTVLDKLIGWVDGEIKKSEVGAQSTQATPTPEPVEVGTPSAWEF